MNNFKYRRGNKQFWSAQYKIYKEAIKTGEPLIKVLPSNPYVIKFISGPTKEQQLAATLSEPKVLKYICGVDSYVAERAIKLDSSVIEYIPRPTEQMWLYALDDNPNLIFKSKYVTWPMFNTVFGKVKTLNRHRALEPAMRTALILVS